MGFVVLRRALFNEMRLRRINIVLQRVRHVRSTKPVRVVVRGTTIEAVPKASAHRIVLEIIGTRAPITEVSGIILEHMRRRRDAHIIDRITPDGIVIRTIAIAIRRPL